MGKSCNSLPMKRFLLWIFLLMILLSPIFLKVGRRIWHPVRMKLTGGKTVSGIIRELKTRGIPDFGAGDYKKLFVVGLKSEQLLEVYGLDANQEIHHLKTFPFTGYSGTLGPKLIEGDRQIPEGIYRVESLNPNSRFHLSVKLDYPNSFDRKKGALDGRKKLGYDIFIHGKSATVGCIPIGDAGMEELFLMVNQIGKENVEVILAPLDFRKGLPDPQITSVSWEAELYKSIRERLIQVPKQVNP